MGSVILTVYQDDTKTVKNEIKGATEPGNDGKAPANVEVIP